MLPNSRTTTDGAGSYLRIYPSFSKSELRETENDVEPAATAICSEVLILTPRTGCKHFYILERPGLAPPYSKGVECKGP